MEHQLNNPLRPSTRTVKTESPTPATSAPIQQQQTQSPKAGNELPPIERKLPEAKLQPKAPSSIPTPSLEGNAPLKPEVKKALDAINAPEDLRKLLLQLSENGIELAGPKKVYVKHSYEVDQELHQRFHEMYPVLGFKKVKDAINDAISRWCDQNESEFKRRSGKK